MASKRRKTRKKKRGAKRRPATRRATFWRIGLAMLMLMLLIGGGYSVYLGKQVRVKFEGKRWAVPARVYARPLELYPGANLPAEKLAHELKTLGYRHVRYPDDRGQWSRNRGRFLIHGRSFDFWDGSETGRLLEVNIDGDRVSKVRDVRARNELDLVRLEPTVIGSIYPTHREDRVLVQRSQIPAHLVDALLAVEDRRFFEHMGIDPRGIARALVANISAGRTVQGGSTLTQQLVKNFLLTDERSLWRKFNEALMALIVESRYDKDEILEAYANEVFLGQDGARAIHGFGLAAFFYFNRPLDELRLHETALLVGLVKGASFYNPRRHPDRARQRRDLVIDAMVAAGLLDADRAAAAKKHALGVTSRGSTDSNRYPGFVQLVRRQLTRDYREEDLTSEGLRIFTTLDPWDQHQAVLTMARQLDALEKARSVPPDTLQGALVIATPQGGEITALLGGRDATVAGFNRALDAIRPVGSLIKPAVYLTALSRARSYTLATLLNDETIHLKLPNGKVWEPDNFDGKARGKVPLHTALADSLNLATVDLGMTVGIDAVVKTLRNLGVERPIDPYPSLLLGATSLTPLEVTQMYQTIAAGGFRSPLRAIHAVSDASNQPLQRYPLTVEQVVDSDANFLLVSNLVEVVERGTGRGAQRILGAGYRAAGKTGTTNDLRDSWFAGFTGDRVAVAWVGRDDNKPIGLTGSTGALPLWARTMRALQSRGLELVAPANVTYQWVDHASGRLSAEDCEGATMLPFIAGSQPQQRTGCAGKPEGITDFFRGLFE